MRFIVIQIPKLFITISNTKSLLFYFILIFVVFTNITNAQNNFNCDTDNWLALNSNSNNAENNIGNFKDVSTDNGIYLDATEDVIGVNDELNVMANTFSKIHGKFIPITGNVKELYKFFRALKSSRTKKIRIAHYGDSILLGDVITENLRQNLQDKFGGDGIGFLSIKPDDIRMKRTINQTVSGKWLVGSIAKGNPKHFPIGMNCITTKATANSSVKYRTTKFMRTSRSFKTVRLFYSNAGSSAAIKYSFEGRKFITKKLRPGLGIQQLIINSKHLENTLDINFGNAAGTYFYGVSLENGNGIYVDNFPFEW